MLTRPPNLVAEIEFTTVEFFISCDPDSDLETREPEELLSLFAGAVLGGMGFELLHHVLEGIEHVSDIADALRPQVQAQQIQRAIAAYRRSPRPFAPGEVKGVWVQLRVARHVLRQTIRQTAPSNQRIAPPVASANAACRQFLPQRLRPTPRPTWA